MFNHVSVVVDPEAAGHHLQWLSKELCKTSGIDLSQQNSFDKALVLLEGGYNRITDKFHITAGQVIANMTFFKWLKGTFILLIYA